MRSCLVLLVVASAALFSWASDKNPPASSTPLSPDQIAIYRAFLSQYDDGSGSDLNLADTTESFDPEGQSTDFTANQACMKGLKFRKLSAKEVHQFTNEFADFKRVHLVDPATQRLAVREHDPSKSIFTGEDVGQAVKAAFAAGLLTLSEVVFDDSGKYALMRYSFVCGSLCGHGGTVVFQRQAAGNWKATKRTCSSWVS